MQSTSRAGSGQDILSPRTAYIEDAAQRLHDSWVRRVPLDPLEGELAPRSRSEAYAIQSQLLCLRGVPAVGWKIGATTAELERHLGIEEPIHGRLLAGSVMNAPARIEVSKFHARPCLECEIGFEIGQDLAPRSEPFTVQEVAATVTGVFPCFELPCFRYTRPRQAGVLGIIADNCASALCVRGATASPKCMDDLPALRVDLEINNAAVASETASRVMGHPLFALHWLVEHLRATGQTLSAGEIVLTGAINGVHRMAAGDTAVAHFGPLGQLEVSFT
ncbi:MAG: fumarylacetoacetate hydrolase family protein [Burkholderiaceae bacterium]|nr:fumarylacetoacetate hydrolase family protein [Burkholderiaceae bacterium]MDO9088688.1 fumarylacetoacetate hydrolase family protein [Burkholderiaceae bacterium]